MIRRELLEPASIAIIGASNDTSKPGGKVLQNLLQHHFAGTVYGVNPKETMVQGVPCYPHCKDLPPVELAIIAIPASGVLPAMEILAHEKSCKAFIIFSAGFGETGEEGRSLEEACTRLANETGATLIGPNCIGVITGRYKGVFAGPIPAYDPQGADLVSASGATMVYLLEMAIPRGLKFRDMFSVGNSAQVGIEDVLQYWDESFSASSSRIKLLYMEAISDPARFLKHARSLIKKGCRIAAIKAGSTEDGSRAVSSHTGALAGSDAAVNALFRKAGIIRCYSRVELVYVAGIFSIQPLKGNRIAVITHAGGPGVMLTDVLTRNGMQVPKLSGPNAERLLSQLHEGSSVSNPIDFLATGTARQLGIILDAVEHDFPEADGSVVVFGTTGMWRVDDVYEVLHQKIRSCSKPIFPILPSNIQAAEEVSHFQSMGHVNFTDEVSFGYVLSRVNKMHAPFEDPILPDVDEKTIRAIIQRSGKGYLEAHAVFELLQAAGIDTVQQRCAADEETLMKAASSLQFPVVMKVDGLLHKSDAGGVVTGIQTNEQLVNTFHRLMSIKGASGVILQEQIRGSEIFIGAKAEPKCGHQVLIGLGGIFVEVFRDISTGLAPIGKEEAHSMIRHLRSYPLIKGARGKEGVNEEMLAATIMKTCALLEAVPEITEMDINPLMGNANSLIAVDARICLG